jgi:hypothetical protein
VPSFIEIGQMVWALLRAGGEMNMKPEGSLPIFISRANEVWNMLNLDLILKRLQVK